MQQSTVGGAQTQFPEQVVSVALGVLLGGHPQHRRRTLHDGAVEQAARPRHREQRCDLRSAPRLSEQRDATGVAAEHRDVVVHPLQGGDDVEQAGITGVGVLVVIAEVQMAEDIEAVVEGNQDNTTPREVGPVESGAAGRSERETAAVQMHHDGQSIVCGETRREDVEDQAVLALRLVVGLPCDMGSAVRRRMNLWRAGAMHGRIEDARPPIGCGGRKRRAPEVSAP